MLALVLTSCRGRNYVGYWAIETGKEVWSVIYFIVSLIRSLFLLGLADKAFKYAMGLTVSVPNPATGKTIEVEVSPPAVLFYIPALGYIAAFIAAVHVLVFGAITLSKLHHGGNNKESVEKKPILPTNTVAPER